MDRASLLELLADGPVIAAVKDDAGLEAALKSDVAVLFLLYGDILTIGETIVRIHQAGKRAFVHLDLIDGLSAREISADFIARHTAADGVISTKSALTKRARELGLVSIQRVFLLDSMALNNVERHFSQESAGGGAAGADAQDHPAAVPNHRKARHCRRTDLRQGRCDRRTGGRRGGRILHQPRCLGHVKSHHLFPEYESETKLPQWGGFVSLFFGYQEVLLCMMY